MQSEKRERRRDVTLRIKELLIKESRYKVKKVFLKFSLKDDMGFDSLELVEIVQKIEDMFNVEIPDTQAEKLKTIRDYINCVLALQG